MLLVSRPVPVLTRETSWPVLKSLVLRREHQRHICYSIKLRIKKAYRRHLEFSRNSPCSFRLRKAAGVQSITTTTPSFYLKTLALLKESQARGCACCSSTTTVSKLPAITTRGHLISVALSPLSTDQKKWASSKAVKYIRHTPVHCKVTANLDWFGWIDPEHELYLLGRRPQAGRSILTLRPSPTPAGFASN